MYREATPPPPEKILLMVDLSLDNVGQKKPDPEDASTFAAQPNKRSYTRLNILVTYAVCSLVWKTSDDMQGQILIAPTKQPFFSVDKQLANPRSHLQGET